MPIIKDLEWTFDTVAEKYARLRPGYVQELYDDIFSYAPIDSSGNAVEIGIGGGQATLPILHTGCKVTSVEYGKKFTDICRKKFEKFPNYYGVTSKFEDYQGKSNSCDLIYSASAFHWISEEIGYKKVYQMLKPGGAFARFANHPYKDKGREELHQALQKIYAVYMPSTAGEHEYSQADAKSRAEIAGKYGFTDIEYRMYKRTRTFTSDEYIELLGTYSDHIVIEESTRRKFFSEIKAAIDDFGGIIDVYDTIDLQLARKP